MSFRATLAFAAAGVVVAAAAAFYHYPPKLVAPAATVTRGAPVARATAPKEILASEETQPAP